MSIDLTTDRDEFNVFIDKQLGAYLGARSLEDALSEFRAYQRELFEVRGKVQEAIEASKQNESSPLEQSHWEEIQNELDRKGMPE